jgi:hypothetical protein
MAKARCRYNRIMPLEAAIFNIRLSVDQAPKEVVAALSQEGQRAWAYLRDANGGNALSKLSRYETSLLREYDRSRQELEKLQKIRAARPTPPPSPTNYEGNPIPHNPNQISTTCNEYATTQHPKPSNFPSTRRGAGRTAQSRLRVEGRYSLNSIERCIRLPIPGTENGLARPYRRRRSPGGWPMHNIAQLPRK